MINIRKAENGIVVPIRVLPNSSREKIIGRHNGQLKIAVTAPPEKGKANRAIVKVIAKWLNIKITDILIISGDKAKDKEVFVRNILIKDVENLLSQIN